MKPTLFYRGIAALSFLALSLTGCATTEAAETYVTIDINPSVGLMIDENGQVSLAHALNADGEMVMLQLQLEGKKAENAVAEIVNEATALEFIDPTAAQTTVSLDALSGDEALQTRIREEVQTHVQTAFAGISAQVQVQTRAYNAEETSEAQEKGVSPLRYRLMMQAMIGDNDLTEDEAKTMDTDALLAHVKNGATQMKAIAASYGKEYLEARQAIQDEYLPQIQAIQATIEAAEANGSDTAALVAQQETLRTQMRQEIQTLANEYKQQTVTARQEWQTMADGIRGGGSSHTTSSATGGTSGNQSQAA